MFAVHPALIPMWLEMCMAYGSVGWLSLCGVHKVPQSCRFHLICCPAVAVQMGDSSPLRRLVSVGLFHNEVWLLLSQKQFWPLARICFQSWFDLVKSVHFGTHTHTHCSCGSHSYLSQFLLTSFFIQSQTSFIYNLIITEPFNLCHFDMCQL